MYIKNVMIYKIDTYSGSHFEVIEAVVIRRMYFTFLPYTKLPL